MVLARWGELAHITILLFRFMSHIMTSMPLLGGAATVDAPTDMDINLAPFLFLVLAVPVCTVYVGTASAGTVYLFGGNGSVMMAIMVFMAITSTVGTGCDGAGALGRACTHHHPALPLHD